jgi:hypothetical protein
MTGSYFYATGPDKAGNTLITSYKKEDQAKKYRAGADIVEGLRYLSIDEDGQATVLKQGDLLLRTMLARKDAQEEMTGDFVVYAKISGRWEQTQFRYKTYSEANTAVKGALINIYDACAVIEEV